MEMRVLEAFWTRYGVNEEQLRQWPPQRVKDYITVLTIESSMNSEQRPAGGAAGRTGSADMTEAAFQAMKSESASAGPAGPHPSEEVRAERAKLFE